MFECPVCGYRDYPCWRAACWLKVAVYCRLDELRVWDPDLAETISVLQPGETLEIGPYTYRLTRNGYVYRILTELASMWKTHGLTEKAAHKKPTKQKS